MSCRLIEGVALFSIVLTILSMSLEWVGTCRTVSRDNETSSHFLGMCGIDAKCVVLWTSFCRCSVHFGCSSSMSYSAMDAFARMGDMFESSIFVFFICV